MRGFTRAKGSSKQPVRNDRRALCGNSFIVESERSKPRTMFLPRVSHDIHKFAAIAKRLQFVEGKKRSAREVGFHPKNTIKLDRVPDRFVNLKSKLRTIKNDGEHPFRTLVSLEERDGFFAHASGVLKQLQLFNQLISFVLPLSAI